MPGARDERHQFELDGGTISLDFVNTVSGMRGEANPRDRLAGYADLVYWAVQVGSIDSRRAGELYRTAEQSPDRAKTAHALAIERREALHDVALSVIDGRPTPKPALATLNSWIVDAQSHRRLQLTAPGRFEMALEDDGDLLAFLRPVALDAAELLGHELSEGLVGVCAERDVGRCAWLFLDTSRNHSRRFCSMKECGNRAKQRRHYQRSRQR